MKIIYFCNQCTFVRQEQSSHNSYGILQRDNVSGRESRTTGGTIVCKMQCGYCIVKGQVPYEREVAVLTLKFITQTVFSCLKLSLATQFHVELRKSSLLGNYVKFSCRN